MTVFPFIVGVGRSGTTLVQAMLNAHPDLAFPFESHFIVPLAEQREQYERPEAFDTRKFVDDLCGWWSFQRWGIEHAAVMEALARPIPNDLADAVRRLYKLHARRRGKRLYGDKTPDYMLSLPFLARLFPEARFIHVIRDGRDVALALRDVEWMRQNAVVDCALYWALRIDTAQRAARWLGPKRYLEVRYERLVDDPRPVLEQVCQFLEVPFVDSVLEHRAAARELVASEPVEREFRTLHLPVTTGLRDWRTQMTADEVKTFELVAGEVIERLGYSLATV